MNNVPKGERMNICFIGKTNVGKSSIINRLIGQEVSIVSEQPGTTTDPVVKRFELLPIGPVTIFDTAGYDDKSSIGEKRIQTTMKVLFRTDLAVLVMDNNGLKEADVVIIDKLRELKIPFVVVVNKVDLGVADDEVVGFLQDRGLDVASYIPTGFEGNSDWKSLLLDMIVRKITSFTGIERDILKDLIKANDKIVMVMPIDASAPKGRIILPQVQVLREILDMNAVALCCTEKELATTLQSLKEAPDLVVTDSQVVGLVSKVVPENVNLTTFSILFSRYRGELKPFVEGLRALKELKEGDLVLIAEACSHHVMDEDIGLVKIPRWLKEYLGIDLRFDKVAGHDFPDDLEKYKLVVHCGGCMITRMEMLRRINECQRRGVAITNYGMLISLVMGSLERVMGMMRFEV